MLDDKKVIIPGREIPSFRTHEALKRGIANNLLFTTWGGIGDQICAEPTLRFALDTFKSSEVSLYTEYPELFSHLKFKQVFTPQNKPDFSKFLVFQTINNPESLTWEFMSHCVTHCVDFPSLCALRCQLPVDYRKVVLNPDPYSIGQGAEEINANFPNAVYIHAGAHWQSKTFPAWWWEKVLSLLLKADMTPVLIGKELDDNRSTVQMTVPDGCIDLRNKTSLTETIWLLQGAKALITNDSSPLHMAASGNAHIAFVATAKHQDYLYHWRAGGWAWRMQHFNKGGIWDLMDHCPNKESDVLVDKCDPETLLSWLPEPEEIVEWVITRQN